MTTRQKVVLVIDIILAIAALVILIGYNYWWALVFVVLLVLPALFSYQFLRKKGELLFKELGEITGCDVIKANRGYPYLKGNYRGREVQIKICRNYPTLLAQLGAADPLKMAEKLKENKPELPNFIAIFVSHNVNPSEIQAEKTFIITPKWIVCPLPYNVGKLRKLEEVTKFLEETVDFVKSFEEKNFG